MDWKTVLKKIYTPIGCSRWKIRKHGNFLYFGKGVKISGGEQMQFGEHVSLMPYSMLVCLRKNSHLEIGENTEIGMFSRIGCQTKVVLGKNVLTGPGIFIADYNHAYEDVKTPIIFQGNTRSFTDEVIIQDDCWIGANVVIVGTVHIGKHCVIGANSVVTKDVPDYSVVAGNPAKILKQYNPNTKLWERI